MQSVIANMLVESILEAGFHSTNNEPEEVATNPI
jgi:hypothetical protein